MNLRVLVLFIAICFSSCEDDDVRQQNPNLLNIQFDIVLDLNLPQYSLLRFPGNTRYVGGPGIGNDGILVVNTGSGFLAWDASDPNRFPDNCTRLSQSFPTTSNSCNPPNSYSVVTGQPLEDGLEFPLLSYRVSANGDSVRVFN